MNAGKSTALLQSNHNYSESNLKTLLFIPKDLGDKSDGKIISRIGLEADAIIVDNEYNFFNEIEKLLGYVAKSEVIHKDDMVEI